MIATTDTASATEIAKRPVADAAAIAAPSAGRVTRLQSLTSLRFFAAGCIVLAHIQGNLATHPSFAYPFALEQGVSFFFVLSGFILTYVYPRLDIRGARRFVVARFARIWPMHIVALLVFLALVPSYARSSVVNVPWTTLVTILLLHAWFPIPNIYAAFNLVSWSISTEFFFYLCFPLLLWRWRQTWYVKLIVAFFLVCAIATLANRSSGLLPTTADLSGLLYVNPLARLFEFTLGVAAAHVWRRFRSRYVLTLLFGTLLEAATVALTVFVMYRSIGWAGWAEHIGFIGKAGSYWLRGSGFNCIPVAALIMVFACENGLLSRVLAFPPFVLLGEISYSIYLIHWPMLTYYKFHTDKFMVVPDKWLMPLFCLAVILTSYTCYALVELPCRRSMVQWWDRHVEKAARTSEGRGQRNPLLARISAPTLLHGLIALSLLLLTLCGVMKSATVAPPSLTDLPRQPAVAFASIDWIGSGPVAFDATTVTIPYSNNPNGVLTIGGWAFDQERMRLAEGAYITVDGTANYWSQYGVDRSDVSGYFKNPRVLRSGFRLSLPFSRLARGEHHVSVKVVNGDGRSYAESRSLTLIIQ